MFKKILKNKNLVLLSTGGFISSIGDYMYNIGLIIYLYSVTNSIGSVAAMWVARGILRIPVQYMAGIMADRFNKKKIIVLTNLLSIPVAFSFIFVSPKYIWISYILAFLLQSLDDMDVCAESAILPEIVEKEELSYSNSLFSFLSSTSIFIAPAIGGIIYKLYGSRILFIINAISFLIAGIMFSIIKYNYSKDERKAAKWNIINEGVEGCRVLIKFADVKIVFLMMAGFAIIGRFYETYKVAVSDILLGLKPEGIVYFDYALAIGGLMVPLVIKLVSKNRDIFNFVAVTFLIGAGYIGFGYSHSVVITIGILVFLGLFQNLQGTYTRTIIQKTIPSKYIGRVFSFYKIILTLFALIGLGLASPLYNAIGVGNSFLITASIIMLLCFYYLSRSSRKDVSKVSGTFDE